MNRSKLIILLLALPVIGTGLYLAGPAGVLAAPAPPGPDDRGVDPAGWSDRWEDPSAGPSEAPPPAVATEPEPEATAPTVLELLSLLAALDEHVRLRPSVFPRETIEELAALLSLHPETVDRFLVELPTLSPGVRTWLVHAMGMISDRHLRVRLKAALAACDTGRQKIDAALRDPDSIVEALGAFERPVDRRDLLTSLTAAHLADRAIAGKLRDLVENDPDVRVRKAAIHRLGAYGGKAGRDLALRVMQDPTREWAERSTAAMTLPRHADDEVVATCLEIVRRGEDPAATLVFAAKCLLSAVGQAGVNDALFGQLLDPNREEKARRSAAGVIADGGRKLEGAARSHLEELAYGALLDLEREPGAKKLYAYTKSEFNNGLGKAFAKRVDPDAETLSTLSHEVR